MKIASVSVFPVVVAFAAATAAAEPLEQRLSAIHERAAEAAADRDWETVERLRLERARILATSDEKTPWVEASRAIAAVDGDAKNPGLVDRLQYKEAAERLRDAWKPFAAMREGPVHGDLAVRLFQVGQQAMAVHGDAEGQGAVGQAVSQEVVREAIEAAAARDPCQLEARAIRLFLRPIDRNETFLRLEVRPDLRAINAGLLDLSWPGSGPVLPHHAPVEFMKAVLTHRLVMEQRYGDFLAPEPVDQAAGAASGFVLRGFDARSKPFRLMYGRFFLMEIDDEAGKPTSAFVYLDAKGEWDKKYLRLLYRTPAAEELKDPDAAFFADFFGKLRPITSWSLGPSQFAIYDLPIESTESILRRRVPQLCVRKVAGLSKARFSRSGNDLDFLVNQLEREPFPTHPRLLERMQQFLAARDRTNHPLIDLTGPRPGEQPTGLNPLIVLSSDDRARPTLMFKRAGASGTPFLTLDDADGSVVEFQEETKQLVVRYPGIDGHLPLTIESVPDAVVLATAAGRLLVSVLAECGYSKAQAAAEIRKVFRDPTYVPAKFGELVKARQKSRQPGGGANTGQIARDILREKGWSLPWLPGEDLLLVYQIFGFRYLTDARGTIVTNAGLSADGGSGAAGADARLAAASTRRLEFRTADGGKAIDDSQVYTEADYGKLRRNIVAEFLPAVVAIHPCLPAIDLAPEGLRAAGAGRIPDGIFGGPQAEADLEQAVRNRLFAEYSKLMLDARSDRRKRELVLSMQLLAARKLAKTGHFHRSLVFYDELVKGVSLEDAAGSDRFRFDLFDRVPTPAELGDFSKHLQSVLEDQKRLIMLQAEQASVLRAAGLRDSASFLFRRLTDQFMHYVLPAIDLSEDYARSYAFAPGKGLDRARKELMDYLAMIAKASAGLRREGEFREAAIAAGLEEWAKQKVEARRSSPQLLYQGDFLLNPVQTCPATYDPDRGFRSDVESLFADDLPGNITAWARLPALEAARDPRSGEHQFLLGWFWLEKKNPDFAWTSFIEAAKAFGGDRAKDDRVALVGRRNGMMMLVAAAAVADFPPGVNAVKTDFVDGLRAQAILWERAWVANRNDGGHARGQREIIGELLDVARTVIAPSDGLESKRYFFPDYTFRHGPLPDLLVGDAIRMKLFQLVARAADDVPIEVPVGSDAEKGGKPQDGKPAEEKKEPEIPLTDLTFEKFLERLYAFPTEIDREILEL